MSAWLFFSRASAVALVLAVPIAALTASGAGCAKSGEEPPPPGGGSQSSVSSGGSSVATNSVVDAGAGPTAVAALGIPIFQASCVPGQPKVDWSPVRRISRVEYNNMVRDLLGDTTQPANSFEPESPMANGVNFDTNTYSGVSSLIVQSYLQTAETLAATAVSSTNNLNNLFNLNNVSGCSTPLSDACAQQFIAQFANRAFRGQLDVAEDGADAGITSSSLFTLYQDVSTTIGDPTAGIQAIITAVLESPRFLYVLEFGNGSASGNTVPLSQYEIAGRLSLFLWRTVPDSALMTAAANGQLATAAQVQAQAQTMIADPKAKDALNDFAVQWMELQSAPTAGKDSQYTVWNSHPQIGEELLDETVTDFSQEVLRSGGTLSDLLTTSSSYINSDLVSLYFPNGGAPATTGATVAVSDPALTQTPSTFTQTPIPNRSGILTTGAVLATTSHTTLPSSVLRGKLVREEILCDVIPPPPPNVPAVATSVPDGGTTRSIFAAHETIPHCVACHQYMDPVGFGYGNFDATGAYQSQDANGFSGTFPPIDATGQVLEMPGDSFSIAAFNGATALDTQLSTATQVQQCFTLEEFRYALSRVENTDDACSVQQAFASFTSAASNGNIQDLMVALTGTDAFLNRSVVPAGNECVVGGSASP